MEQKDGPEVVERFGAEKENQEKADAERIRQAVWPIASRFIKQISMHTNNRFKDGARMTGAVAFTICERTMVSIVTSLYKNDQATGIAFIEKIYERAKQECIAEWKQNF